MLFIVCPESCMWLIGQLQHRWRRREEREGMNNPFKQGQASLFWKPQGLGLSVLGAQISSALTLSQGTFPCTLGKSQNLLILWELTALEMQLCWNSGVQHQQQRIRDFKGKNGAVPWVPELTAHASQPACSQELRNKVTLNMPLLLHQQGLKINPIHSTELSDARSVG